MKMTGLMVSESVHGVGLCSWLIFCHSCGCDFNDVAKNLNLNVFGCATEVRPNIDPNRPK